MDGNSLVNGQRVLNLTKQYKWISSVTNAYLSIRTRKKIRAIDHELQSKNEVRRFKRLLSRIKFQE